MEQVSNTVFKERLVAIFLTVAGIYVLAFSSQTMEENSIRSNEYLLTLLFAGVMILANHFPIHLLRGTKFSLINLPIFLSTALLSAPLAILATGSGVLIAHILVRRERGLLPRDIASTVGQWMFAVFWGSQILQLSLPSSQEHT